MEQYLFPAALLALVFLILAFIQWRAATNKLEQVENNQLQYAKDQMELLNEIKTGISNLHSKISHNHTREMAKKEESEEKKEYLFSPAIDFSNFYAELEVASGKVDVFMAKVHELETAKPFMRKKNAKGQFEKEGE